MISTRRIAAAAALAAGVAGFAAPLAHAAEAVDTGRFNPVTTLDTLTTSGIPAEHRAALPPVSGQLAELNKVSELNKLNELHQLTDLVAPVTGLLPAVRA
ncbi:hypothetical protein [Streptomyces sp. NPDC002588]|uniref:hypothetical protein n=1 Tax=Streptomyces sp. NPDC002588 TaxID=3154419 RepID=UPI00331C39DD